LPRFFFRSSAFLRSAASLTAFLYARRFSAARLFFFFFFFPPCRSVVQTWWG
jgi:hypothetical protein